MGRKAKDTKPTSIRPSKVADYLWEKLARHHGLDKHAVFEMAMRNQARHDGLDVPESIEHGTSQTDDQRGDSNSQ